MDHRGSREIRVVGERGGRVATSNLSSALHDRSIRIPLISRRKNRQGRTHVTLMKTGIASLFIGSKRPVLSWFHFSVASAKNDGTGSGVGSRQWDLACVPYAGLYKARIMRILYATWEREFACARTRAHKHAARCWPLNYMHSPDSRGSASPNARARCSRLRVYASKGRKGQRAVPYLQLPDAYNARISGTF